MENFIQLSTDFLSIFSRSCFPPFLFFTTKFEQYLWYVLEIIVDRIAGSSESSFVIFISFRELFARSSSFWFKTWDVKNFFSICYSFTGFGAQFQSCLPPTHIYTHAVNPIFPSIHSCNNYREKKQRKKWIQLANNTLSAPQRLNLLFIECWFFFCCSTVTFHCFIAACMFVVYSSSVDVRCTSSARNSIHPSSSNSFFPPPQL